MHVIDLAPDRAETITDFDSVAASAMQVAGGTGEAHCYCVHFEPGGSIGRHVAGFAQLFVPVMGEGWAAGADGVRARLRVGQAAFFERGEMHSKGSDNGMTALMVQVRDLKASSAETGA